MTIEHTLRCYDYVNQPFNEVHSALSQDAIGIFTRATRSAAERERAIGVQLHVRLGVLDVATDVRVEVGPPRESLSSPHGYGVAIFPLTWSSLKSPSLFPRMQATLSIYPLSRTETQLDFEGSYDPPFGLLGDALDAMAGHRIAEASALQFVRDVAAFLRADLARAAPRAPAAPAPT